MGQIFEEDLYELGIALFSLFNGFTLTQKQLLLIINAEDSEKIHAMKIVAKERLKNDQNDRIDIFFENLAYLEALKTTKIR